MLLYLVLYILLSGLCSQLPYGSVRNEEFLLTPITNCFQKTDTQTTKMFKDLIKDKGDRHDGLKLLLRGFGPARSMC